jgi:NADH dehydrogenase
MDFRNVLVIGGSGFVGSHLVHHLATRGLNVRVPTRHRDRAKHLLVFPTVEVVAADVHDPAALLRLMDGQDAVINLVGILQGGSGSPYGAGFARAHVELPEKIIAAMQRSGIRRLLHMSALQAAADAPSGYLRSKAAAEAAVRASGLDFTIFRPSIIFGDGDAFLTLFAKLLAIAPLLPLACPEARFQPVWVDDVGASIDTALERQESIGQAYDLGGPKQYTLRQLVAYAGEVSGHPRPIIGLPDGLAYLQALAMEFVPGGPMSRDNFYSMQLPSVCAAGCVLPFGRQATALEAVAPGYLKDGRRRACFDRFRGVARR